MQISEVQNESLVTSITVTHCCVTWTVFTDNIICLLCFQYWSWSRPRRVQSLADSSEVKWSSVMHHGKKKPRLETQHLLAAAAGRHEMQQRGHTIFTFLSFKVDIISWACYFSTSEGEMLKTSAILAYSSFTLVNPWMRPVGLPWASWVWKMSLGLGYSGGPGGGGEGGGSGGAVGSKQPWFWFWLWLWAFCSSMASAPAALESCGLIASPFCIGPQLRYSPAVGAQVVHCSAKKETTVLQPPSTQPSSHPELWGEDELVMSVAW